MDKELFSKARKRLGKTQRELAELLGVSLKAVQSYEQGWRRVPLHVERQLYFLLANHRGRDATATKTCWVLKKCRDKERCPAWEFQAGHLCWFLNGTRCDCGDNAEDKLETCRQCEILAGLL